MSNPDPMNDPENERQDDDLLRDELDAMRWWDEQDMKAEQRAKDGNREDGNVPDSEGLKPNAPSLAHHDDKYLAECRWTRLYNEAWAAWADGKPFTWPPTAEQLRR